MVIAVLLLYALNGMCLALVIIFFLSRRPFNHIHAAIIYTLMLYLLFFRRRDRRRRLLFPFIRGAD